MAIREFICRDCGFKSERIEYTPDPTLPICPRDGLEMEKQISVPADAKFVGSGWGKPKPFTDPIRGPQR